MWTLVITTVLPKIKNFLFSKNGALVSMGVTLVMLVWFVSILFGTIKEQKFENNRISNNFINAEFKMDSIVLENHKILYSVNKLNVTNDELKQTNSLLVDDVKQLKIKLKNVSAITKIEYKYIYVQDSTDTIPIEKKSDSVYLVEFKNQWIYMTQRISLIDNKSSLKIDKIKITITDSLLIVNETLYKRKMIFWRKPIGGKIHVTGENPYLHVNKIQTYEIIKPGKTK